MKKLILISAIFLSASCSKEEGVEPVCNCGLITADNVVDYSVTIRNDCSGNLKVFTLTQGDWINAHVGSNYCIYNITNW